MADKETTTEETSKETPEVNETPSIEDRLATLEVSLQEKNTTIETQETTISAITADLDSANKGLKTTHARIEEGNKKHKKDVQSMSALVSALAKSEVLDPEVAANIQADAKDAETQASQDEYTTQAADIWKQTQALGFTEDDDEGGNIYDILQDGLPSSLNRATRLLKKLEKTKEKPEVVETKETKETETQKIDRLVQEKMREKGLLGNTETGESGGVTKSDAEFTRDYGSGELPATKENQERARKIQSSLT